MRPAVFTWPAADTDAICLSQTLGAAGALTINGALLDLAETTYGVRRVVLAGIQRVVTATSAGDISTVTFTITGKDLRGAAVTDTITGVNASTVATTAEFHTITSVTADGAVGTAVLIGTGAVGSTNWYTCDGFSNPSTITVGVTEVSGTIKATVQNTLDDVQTNDAPTVFDHPTIADVTAATESNYAFPPRFVRAINEDAASTGAFTFTIVQAG